MSHSNAVDQPVVEISFLPENEARAKESLDIMRTFPNCCFIACLAVDILLSPLSHAAADRFARFAIQPVQVYAGQTFLLTLSIYTTGEALDKNIIINGMPPVDALKCSAFSELTLQQETIDGRVYEIRRFQSQAVSQRSGSLVLAPSLQGTLIRENRSYFFVQRQSIPAGIPVEPFTLSLRPIPVDGRPLSFSGAVGEFVFSAKASPLDVAVGDIVTIDMRIDGVGLPDSFTPPSLQSTDSINTYQPKPILAESSSTSRLFRQTIVPYNTSLDAIPRLSFCFFNTRSGQYETQTVGPFPLTFHAERASLQRVYTPRTNDAPAPIQPHSREQTSVFWKRALSLLGGRPTEQITIEHDTEVRLAPSANSLVLFLLKSGSGATVDDCFENWIRIESRSGTGWIPAPSPVKTALPP